MHRAWLKARLPCLFCDPTFPDDDACCSYGDDDPGVGFGQLCAGREREGWEGQRACVPRRVLLCEWFQVALARS